MDISPDVVARIRSAIHDHTVALRCFDRLETLRARGAQGDVEPYSVGSGVLLAVGPARFILTAGHFAQDLPGRALLVPSRSYPTGGEVRVADMRARNSDEEADCGVIEIDPRSVWAAEGSKVFLAPRRLGVLGDASVVVVQGKPAALYTDTETRPMTMFARVAGREGVPEAPRKWESQIGLWVHADRSHPVGPQGDDFTPDKLPDFIMGGFAGTSGGGVWTADLDAPPDVAASSRRLVAIYVGSGPAQHDPRGRFGLAIPLHAHLDLIREMRPDLEEHLPELSA